MTKLNRAVRRTTRVGDVPHGVRNDLVITLYPGGVIGLREHRRRREFQVSAGTLYTRLVNAEVLKARRVKKGRG